MGLSSALSLNFEPRPIFRDLAAAAGDSFRRRSLLDEYVKSLEVERGKIDGLKRELPLCMSLLCDAIDVLKVEVAHCKAPVVRSQPILDEFLPVRGCGIGDHEKRCKSEAKDCRDKKDWMRSAQLWTGYPGPTKLSEKTNQFEANLEFEESDPPGDIKPFFGGKEGGGSGALCSFKQFSGQQSEVSKENKKTPFVADLTLMVPAGHNTNTKSDGSDLGLKTFFGLNQTLPSENQACLGSQQHLRKTRRCWSQELHRVFVKALEQLGGAKVATPKQIIEHMRVDGLTNDEVKSHLQKYRLHLRKIPPSALRSSSQPLYLSGEGWDSHNLLLPSRPSSSLSGSPQSPFQLSGTGGCIFNTLSDGCEEDEKSSSNRWKHLKDGAVDGETEYESKLSQ